MTATGTKPAAAPHTAGAVVAQPIKRITSRVALGPMSREIIDAVVKYSQRHNVQLMLIASRNQIECEEFGGGYVDGFTTETLAEHVRGLDGTNVVICRDHAGPYMGDDESGLDPQLALERAAFSVRCDVESGFDLIHVDCCRHKGDVGEATATLIDEATSQAQADGRDIRFEVGTEENVGLGTDARKFAADLKFITERVRPEFVVGQTGSLIKETFQVGFFDFQRTKRLVELAHSFGVKFKEHNADYLSPSDLFLRRAAGVDAVNVAPELGVVQTKTVVTLAQRFGRIRELRAFLERVVAGKKWHKWLYGRPVEGLKGLIGGHYHFGSDEYRALVDSLRRQVDLDGAIAANVNTVIDRYVGGLR